MEIELQPVGLAAVILESNVVGAFAGIAEKRLEKLIGAFGGKEAFQTIRRE
jgi:hypothetical protein